MNKMEDSRMIHPNTLNCRMANSAGRNAYITAVDKYYKKATNLQVSGYYVGDENYITP